ncbi:MAG: hypothetical protein SWX82_26530 [Cyanobacteriota bacterium]|nr:hypothetical protein [Cyanobacteriota bacterium]
MNGVQNLTYLEEAEKKAKIKWAAIAHEAYCNMSKLHEFVSGKQKEKIYLNTVPYRNAIAIGSTKNSVTTFWTGVGILEEIEIGKYKDWILNPSQLTELLKYGYAEENLELFSENNLRNLRKIKITDRDFFLHLGRYRS